MELGLTGKVALVVGAGGGLGSAIALTLANEGAAIAACDVDEVSLAALGERLAAQRARFITVRMDLRDTNQLPAHAARIEKELGAVDVLVNNSGGPPPSLANGVAASVWRDHFDSMVLSLISLTDLVVPAMKARHWGRIITSTSSGVVAPIPNLGLSNALRLALVGWSKTIARELGPSGITANVVLPGRIATSRIDQLDRAKAQREGRPVEDVVCESTASIPAGRYGTPEEYGQVVAFLASQQASYINGSVIRVDGGLIPSI
ncbi:SDR family oxidoreductase [Variovorax sp. J22P271]|uniref:SDR family oxidoreductase n=1 Tax=Variovorax davisae TaxID=3053515 RepID=UPI002577BD9C|nr:SDR family oxidoreductase [Variovorax sp. J22P271]MDM0032311.1 SDR family oxidoreductase [Variovorax sp. J22P271]